MGAIVTIDQIASHLHALGITNYRRVEHAPTRTSAESAAVRGESMEIGAKALLLKADNTDFMLFVMSAARQLDSRAIKDRFNIKRFRFATPEELKDLTGLVPGCVPPFGPPIMPFRLHVDASILQLDRVAFNAATLTESIIMPREAYLRAAAPAADAIFAFTKPAEGAKEDRLDGPGVRES